MACENVLPLYSEIEKRTSKTKLRNKEIKITPPILLHLNTFIRFFFLQSSPQRPAVNIQFTKTDNEIVSAGMALLLFSIIVMFENNQV